MKSPLSWDDLALFCCVARAGNLSHAALHLGSSPATLSRRMTALEAQMGRRLFLRGAQGYAPSAEGRALLEKATRMQAAAAEIAQWRDSGSGPVRVRISAGTWTALHLGWHLTEIWQRGDPWVPELVQANRNLDIARRDIDIGIRNRRPDHPWLAGRMTGIVEYACYGRDSDVTGWIGARDGAADARSAAWVQAQHGGDVVTAANDPQLALAMAQAGIGRVVLPCFVGDGAASLVRLSDPIADLRSEEWLVCHNDARFEPAIRAALDALAGFLSQAPRVAKSRTATDRGP